MIYLVGIYNLKTHLSGQKPLLWNLSGILLSDAATRTRTPGSHAETASKVCPLDRSQRSVALRRLLSWSYGSQGQGHRDRQVCPTSRCPSQRGNHVGWSFSIYQAELQLPREGPVLWILQTKICSLPWCWFNWLSRDLCRLDDLTEMNERKETDIVIHTGKVKMCNRGVI